LTDDAPRLVETIDEELDARGGEAVVVGDIALHQNL
jgi:hypothetical protein